MVLFASRATATSRHVMAGCFTCHGTEARWFGGNAQGVAARHHDATGHPTWCDVAMSIRYGREAADDRQIDIEDSIALLGGPAPAPVLPAHSDAPTAAPAGESLADPRRVSAAGHPGRRKGRIARGTKTLAPETPQP